MFRHFFVLWLVIAAVAPVVAEEVEVTAVKFSNLRPPGGGSGAWLETEVLLNVRPATAGPGQMVSRVRVALLLGFELAAKPGSERRIEHYRAEAECVALEVGRTSVRFYLPAELVKRDLLHGDPKFWGVELWVGGRPVPAARTAYCLALVGAEQRKNFQQRAGAAAAPNDGLLQPQYLTPFAHDYARAAPSFVRKDGR